MLLLSIILISQNYLFAQPKEGNIQSFFSHYIQQVAEGKVDKTSYSEEFQSIAEDDKVLFKSCAQQKCKVKTSAKKMKHNDNLWQLQTEISFMSGKETKTFEYRRGCYYLSKENKKWKLLNYIEDCQAH